MCWMTGLFVGYLPALGWNDGTRREGICTFKNMKTTEYYHFRNMFVTVIPFISLVFIYGLIYREIRNVISIHFLEMFLNSVYKIMTLS